MKILVADDSKTTLTMLIESLQRLGHTVVPANNGQQAIEMFKEDRPDLIILDVVMEGISGFDCAKQIRALNTEDWIPIIFLSATVDDKHISEGINAGGDDYLTKPYSEITLAAKIKAMQRISDMRQQLFSMTTKLSILSSTDALTGIANRLSFDKCFKEKFYNANRYHKQLALLFIDLDKFKAVNDSLGHYIGDLLLKEVSKRLQSCLRLDDFIARLGGDEFAIIIADIDNVSIVNEIAQKIINAIGPTYLLAGNEINIGCSIGIATYSRDNNITLETLAQNADIAMYHAKEVGRNNYQNFSEELDRKHSEQIDLENSLRVAIEKQELYLLYQPIFNLASKEIVRMEVLCSWQHPTFGRISANQFLPLAEEIGLIDTITLWIIKTACEQSMQWSPAGNKFKLSINISPRQLMQKNLLEVITHTLSASQISNDQLELELTETSPLIYSEFYADILQKIHNTGINIVLDNFGTASSSLSHLQLLPIKGIKIDHAFVKEIATNNTAMLKSLITLGNNLGFDVIAEGIETKEQLQFLIEHSCKQGQGYFLCRPKNMEEMTTFLREHKIVSTT